MNRIKELREEKNITQEELSKKLDLSSRGIVSMYEKEERKPSLEILIKLSEIFDCSIDYLLGKTEIRNIEELKKVRFANAGGLDVDGLDEDDLLELQKQVDYIKKLKGKK